MALSCSNRNSQSRRPARDASGFTLIELLIVVAIISILASIAVPNFLEAQTRAKVARILSDMRTVAVGVEMYHVDHGRYPQRQNPIAKSVTPRFDFQARDMSRITTPIAYLTSLPLDIFDRSRFRSRYLIDYFDPSQTSWFVLQSRGITKSSYFSESTWMLVSVGPDGYLGVLPTGAPGFYPPQPSWAAFTLFQVYDPTNGTASIGNIFRFSGQQDPHTFLTTRDR